MNALDKNGFGAAGALADRSGSARIVHVGLVLIAAGLATLASTTTVTYRFRNAGRAGPRPAARGG